MFNKDHYSWETDDYVGQTLSEEVDSVINEALSKLSEIESQYIKQINENQSSLNFNSIEKRINHLIRDKAQYIGEGE